VTVKIIDQETGQSQVLFQPDVPVEDWPPFIWEDGNYACDCNRARFFDEAAGVTRENYDHVPCTGKRYHIVITQGDLTYQD
jgi:hypothetical protein